MFGIGITWVESGNSMTLILNAGKCTRKIIFLQLSVCTSSNSACTQGYTPRNSTKIDEELFGFLKNPPAAGKRCVEKGV